MASLKAYRRAVALRFTIPDTPYNTTPFYEEMKAPDPPKQTNPPKETASPFAPPRGTAASKQQVEKASTVHLAKRHVDHAEALDPPKKRQLLAGAATTCATKLEPEVIVIDDDVDNEEEVDKVDDAAGQAIVGNTGQAQGDDNISGVADADMIKTDDSDDSNDSNDFENSNDSDDFEGPELTSRSERTSPSISLATGLHARPQSQEEPPDVAAAQATPPDGGAALLTQQDARQERELEPAEWPSDIMHLASSYNPSKIQFSRVDGFGRCQCLAPCRVHTCQNGSLGLSCSERNCSFRGKCGNGLSDLDGLRIMRTVGTEQLTLTTTKPIDNGIVVGEYSGELSLDVANSRDRPSNEGYRLELHRDDFHKRTDRVCINTLKYGSMMRFLNHACDPTAVFMEMSNGTSRHVVVVTTRRVRANVELTDFYGNELWFQ